MNSRTQLLHALMLAGLATVSVVHAAPNAVNQTAAGRTIFQNNCASCHTVDAGLAPLAGPGLFGVVGRKAAGVAGFNYSAALAKAGAGGTVWTRDELDVFLLDPAKRVPGTAMPVGVPDATQRGPPRQPSQKPLHKLLRKLKTAPAPGPKTSRARSTTSSRPIWPRRLQRTAQATARACRRARTARCRP